MKRHFVLFALVGAGLMASMGAQCVKDYREDKKAGIHLTDLTITGTTTLSSDELTGIAGELSGSCFDEDLDELGERLRAQFQDRGYFKVEVKGTHMKATDPLAVPKPVTIEAEVVEGARYKLGKITFVNNHAFTSEQLRQEFSIKTGDWFSRGKVASGLEGLGSLLSKNGFLDWSAVPTTEIASDAMVNLAIDIDEGPQYHLQKVEFAADKSLAARLAAQWKLDEGAPYDRTYIDQYIEANRDLLPSGFGRQEVEIGKNCPEASIALRLVIDPKEAAAESKPKNVACEKKEDKKEK